MDHPLEGQRSLMETQARKHDPYLGATLDTTWEGFGKPKALLRHVRINELVLQTLFPWLLAHFSMRKDFARQQKVVRFFLLWPPSEDHIFSESTTRQLFESDRYQWIQSSADQLVLLQIIHDFAAGRTATATSVFSESVIKYFTLKKGLDANGGKSKTR